ncbi:MAG: tRNA 4-thiouridine(8) synthase ThiI, partial [Candidatus Woesearchaeota archaeon]
MQYTHLLLREGELFLKGKNKNIFENKLVNNLRKKLPISDLSIKKLRGRLLTSFFSENQIIKQIFGLVSYSPVIKTEKDID